VGGTICGEQQIPCEDDRKKSKGNNKGKSGFFAFGSE
jgi:hypothetical protein